MGKRNLSNGHKKELEEKYGLKEIGIFGSYVRGEQLQNSDIDILFTMMDLGEIHF